MRPFGAEYRTVAVIIPAFNKATTITGTIEQLHAPLAAPDSVSTLWDTDDRPTEKAADVACAAGVHRAVRLPL